jgi:isopenicillin N synthase-like dioxygenase
LVVNVGEQLAAMSNERFKATIHRVLDIGKDR